MTKRFTVNWLAPTDTGGSAITGYDVGYTPSGGTETVVSTGSTATSYAISGLADDTLYNVRVRAENAQGAGTWSSYFPQMAWLPTDLADLSCWIDGSDSAQITTDANGITSVADKSGNGIDAVQSTDAAKPSVVPAEINNLSVIRFGSGKSLWFPIAAAGPLGSNGDSVTDWTLFFVMKTATLANAAAFVQNGINVKAQTQTALPLFRWTALISRRRTLLPPTKLFLPRSLQVLRAGELTKTEATKPLVRPAAQRHSLKQPL